jgi:hypothetical protein
MTGPGWILVLALGSAGLAAPPDAQELLASARGLYASAAYEEALAVLGTAEAVEPGVALELERYRALCLFALGQRDAARAALATLVGQHPLYVPTEADLPPTLVSMVHEVRRELLPDIARRTYADVRAQLASGQTAVAVPALERVVQITGDPDVSGVEGMADLRLLADGFLALAKATAAAAPPPETAPTSGSAEAVPAAEPTTGTNGTTTDTPAAASGAAASRALYTAADADVAQPGIIEQEIPPWWINSSSRSGMTFTGYLRVVIDETGAVESAAMLRPVHPGYDPELLRVAKQWRYTPALKDGKPVRFLKVIQIVVRDI